MAHNQRMAQVQAPTVVSVAQAASRLGLNRRTVLRAIQAGHIAASKTGPGTAGFVIDEAEVARLEAERTAS